MVPCCHLNRGDTFIWGGRVYRMLEVLTRDTVVDGKPAKGVDVCEVECIGNIGENNILQLLPAQTQNFNPYTDVRQVALLLQVLV